MRALHSQESSHEVNPNVPQGPLGDQDQQREDEAQGDEAQHQGQDGCTVVQPVNMGVCSLQVVGVSMAPSCWMPSIHPACACQYQDRCRRNARCSRGWTPEP